MGKKPEKRTMKLAPKKFMTDRERTRKIRELSRESDRAVKAMFSAFYGFLEWNQYATNCLESAKTLALEGKMLHDWKLNDWERAEKKHAAEKAAKVKKD